MTLIGRLCVMASQASPEFFRELSPMDCNYVGNVDAVRKMREYVAAERYQEALDVYQRMPELLKKHRHVLHQRLVASCRLEGQFDEALRTYRAASPADPGIDLYLVNYYLLHRKFDDVLACVDRLDRAVGGDPLFDAHRAFAQLHKGNLAAAKKCAQNAVAAEPDSDFARISLNLVSQIEKNSPADRPAGPKSSDASPGEPAGDVEARAFAEAFEKTVMSSDMAAVRTAIDIAALNRRVLAKLDIPEETRIGAEFSLASSTGAAVVSLFAVGQPAIEQGARFRLLHLRRDGAEQWALYRLVARDGGILYFDCLLMRHADGKVRIDNVYPFQMGEMMSEYLHRFLAIGFENWAKASQAARAEAANDGARLGNAILETVNRTKAGRYQEALDVCLGLPDRFQKEKAVLAVRIQAARGVGGKPYDDAIRAYRKEFPGARNMDLIMIDAYFAHKLYDRALASIDGLDHTLGGDPYLDTLRANVYIRKATLPPQSDVHGSRSKVNPVFRRRTLPFF